MVAPTGTLLNDVLVCGVLAVGLFGAGVLLVVVSSLDWLVVGTVLF